MNKLRTLVVDAARVDVKSGADRQTLYVAIDEETRKMVSSVVAPEGPEIAIRDLLSRCASDWGLPQAILTDNSPGFTSQAFSDRLADYGIRHEVRASYAAAEKGSVERAVAADQNFISAMRSETGLAFRHCSPLFSDGDAR